MNQYSSLTKGNRVWLPSILVRLFFGLMLALSGSVHAEDIDLFLGNPSNTLRPNVLLVIDNASSNSSNITQLTNGTGKDKLDMLKDILNVLTDPVNSPFFPACSLTVSGGVETRTPVGCITRQEALGLIKNINLGLMLMNPSGSTTGGYVRYHIRPMDNETNRLGLWNSVKDGIPKANNAPYAKSMHEAYLYYAGQKDYAGFSSNLYDPVAKNGVFYNSPITEGCGANYILFVGNGGPDSGEESDSGKLLSALGGVLTSDPLRFSPSNSQSNWFDEYARTLKRKDVSSTLTGEQSITTYTIAVQNPADNNYNTAPMQSARALLQSGALAGGGEYALGQDGAAVLKAFYSALRKMQPVNSVFAAVTLPVSVNVRGTFLNQVYMGQFRPDVDARIRWPGNLKQYQIALDSNSNPVLADRDQLAVEDTVNGFLLPDRSSFWTKSSTYWNFSPYTVSNDKPDGSVVEKGGAAQRLRADFSTTPRQDNRNLYTCSGLVNSCLLAGTALSTNLFKTSNGLITTSALGITSGTSTEQTAERTALIDWVRGQDNREDENLDGATTDIRAYIHGDLLHSRPAVVNYNRYGDDRDIMVYYGANDGVFRGVKGGQSDDDGYEKWGFVFPEFFSKLKTLRDNTATISAGVSSKPYFADGAVSVYQNDANNNSKLGDVGDQVYLYVGMRRGGRFAYALDVSNPDTPKFLWKIDNTMTGFSTLGQTWSSFRPTSIKAVPAQVNGGVPDPVVIFGGGYDPISEDPATATATTMGKGIYVVNGRTGALIKHIVHADMGSMPADLTVLDRNSDNKADRVYAPDTKGNVWRADIDDVNPDNWTVYKLATLGGALGGPVADARKFLNKVDVVYGTTFDAVLVGSGDREHPFEQGVVDRFYMLKDKVNLAGGLICGTTAVPATCTHSDLTDVTSNGFQTTSLPTTSKGWFMTFGAGEKLVNSPVTVFGTVIFGTNSPAALTPGSCSNLGEARLYQIGFQTGNAVQDLNSDNVLGIADRYSVLKGGGFPPSPVYSPVTIDGKRREVVCVGTRCFKPGAVNIDTKRKRTYWFTKQ